MIEVSDTFDEIEVLMQTNLMESDKTQQESQLYANIYWLNFILHKVRSYVAINIITKHNFSIIGLIWSSVQKHNRRI